MFKAISASADEAQTLIHRAKYLSRDVPTVVLCYGTLLRVPPQLHGSSPNQMSSRLSIIAVFVESTIGLLVNLLKLREMHRLGAAQDLVTMDPIPDLYCVFNVPLDETLQYSKGQEFDSITSERLYHCLQRRSCRCNTVDIGDTCAHNNKQCAY
jgi:hypothetical protein